MLDFTVATGAKNEIVDITDKISEVVKDKNSGLVNIFVKHTTCAVTTADLDPGTEEDYLNAFKNLVPKITFRHPHNPSHFPDHFLASTVGANILIPFTNGKLELGTWQRIILLEFDGPREREIVVTLIKD